jgi:aspartyl-tRNA(Asn)/glutamyl-tRNA(Gln) amidotransferase subunit A
MSAHHWLSATEIAEAYAAKTLTPRQLLIDLLTRIEALDPKLNAFIRLDADGAMADAVRYGLTRRSRPGATAVHCTACLSG